MHRDVCGGGGDEACMGVQSGLHALAPPHTNMFLISFKFVENLGKP